MFMESETKEEFYDFGERKVVPNGGSQTLTLPPSWAKKVKKVRVLMSLDDRSLVLREVPGKSSS